MEKTDIKWHKVTLYIHNIRVNCETDAGVSLVKFDLKTFHFLFRDKEYIPMDSGAVISVIALCKSGWIIGNYNG